MAAIEIVFSGLMVFSNPDGKGRVAVTVVTGEINSNEHHSAELQIGNGKPRPISSGEWVLGGSASKPVERTPGFLDLVPSVGKALAGVGETKYRPSGCVGAPDSSCLKIQNYLVLTSGSLHAELRKEDDQKTYCFMVEKKGDYCTQMSHNVVWSGSADTLTIGGETIKLMDGMKLYITNHPRQVTGRHFGVYRHLWGAGNNGSEEGWPLPISANGLLGKLGQFSGQSPMATTDAQALQRVIEILTIQRPQFCPPARE